MKKNFSVMLQCYYLCEYEIVCYFNVVLFCIIVTNFLWNLLDVYLWIFPSFTKCLGRTKKCVSVTKFD